MTASRRLKIWTLITHALIIVGWGHGGVCLAIIEIMSLPYFLNSLFSSSSDSSFEILLLVVGFTTLVGQSAIIFSLLTKRLNLKTPIHIVGLILLWTSIISLKYFTSKDNHVYLATITCLPFLVCNVIFFAGQPIKRLYYWVLDV